MYISVFFPFQQIMNIGYLPVESFYIEWADITKVKEINLHVPALDTRTPVCSIGNPY